MKIVLACGDDTFYAAAGENGAKAIKRLIDCSVEAHAAKLPLASVSLALGPVWDIFRMYKPGRKTKNIAAKLDGDGQNRINFTIEAVDNGLRCRLEVEEGVDMLLGAAPGTLNVLRTTSLSLRFRFHRRLNRRRGLAVCAQSQAELAWAGDLIVHARRVDFVAGCDHANAVVLGRQAANTS